MAVQMSLQKVQNKWRFVQKLLWELFVIFNQQLEAFKEAFKLWNNYANEKCREKVGLV